MTITSRMSLIMGLIGAEQSELFAICHIVYTLASTNVNQSAPNLVKMYITVTSRISSIMSLIGPE